MVSKKELNVQYKNSTNTDCSILIQFSILFYFLHIFRYKCRCIWKAYSSVVSKLGSSGWLHSSTIQGIDEPETCLEIQKVSAFKIL